MYVQVAELPDTLREALRSVGYARGDINVEASETYSPLCTGGQGRRGFCLAVCLSNGATEAHVGSWGGANMFNPGNAVDLDSAEHPLNPGFAVINGSQGDKTYASLTLHPSNIVALLPAKVELTARQAYLVNCYAGLTSAGRKDAFERGRYGDPSYSEAGPRLGGAPSDAELTELEGMGLIKRNRAGAVSITTAGRNARVARGGFE